MALAKEADLDFVVANDVSKVKGDTTSITIFDRKGHSETFEGSKSLAAERVWRAGLDAGRGRGGVARKPGRLLPGPRMRQTPSEGGPRDPAPATHRVAGRVGRPR